MRQITGEEWGLTKDDKDEEQGRYPRGDVEHDADVVSQLVQVVHVRYQNGWNQEPQGNTQLWGIHSKTPSKQQVYTSC